jgi:thiamine biosynthesis lipoprotein
MLALLEPRAAAGSAALAPVPGWFDTWEQHLSRFRDDSELSRLNRSQGQLTTVSPVLWEVVDAAFHAATQTDGLVSPTLLEAMEATGYDRSFELIREAPTGSLRSETVAQATMPRVLSWWAITRDPRTHALQLPHGLRLDLGGIAKGWAADRAAEQLGHAGPALVDAGGDIAVSGPLPEDKPWPVGVADPMAPDRDLEILLVRRGGVATSGRDYRRWQHAGRWQHHILDPRTGRPATTDVLSATVVAPTACEAEASAKVALILGSRDGLTWLDARPELAGLLVLEDGRVLRSRRLQAYVPARPSISMKEKDHARYN